MDKNNNNNKIKITLVNDNSDLQQKLMIELRHLGYQVLGVKNTEELKDLRKTWTSHIYIFNDLLGVDAELILEQLVKSKDIGIIILAARAGNLDNTHGLEKSVDIYLTKPIDLRALNACIISIYESLIPQIKSTFWLLDIKCQILISPDNRLLNLTNYDIKIITGLLEISGQTVGRQKLYEILNFKSCDQSKSRLNTFMCRLRKKLNDFDNSINIQTDRGNGYSLLGPKIVFNAY